MRIGYLPLLLLPALLVACSPTTGFGYVSYSCAHPRPAVIATGREAILAARSIMHCIRPDLDPRDEASWLKDYGAEQRANSWHIGGPRLPKGYVGTGLIVDISRKDGSLIDAYMTG